MDYSQSNDRDFSFLDQFQEKQEEMAVYGSITPTALMLNNSKKLVGMPQNLKIEIGIPTADFTTRFMDKKKEAFEKLVEKLDNEDLLPGYVEINPVLFEPKLRLNPSATLKYWQGIPELMERVERLAGRESLQVKLMEQWRDSCTPKEIESSTKVSREEHSEGKKTFKHSKSKTTRGIKDFTRLALNADARFDLTSALRLANNYKDILNEVIYMDCTSYYQYEGKGRKLERYSITPSTKRNRLFKQIADFVFDSEMVKIIKSEYL